MTIENIMIIVTALTTYIIGFLTKGNLIDKKYIPLQNIVVGLFTGLIAYACGLSTELLPCVLNCIIGSMTAGGTYDLITIKKENTK